MGREMSVASRLSVRWGSPLILATASRRTASSLSQRWTRVVRLEVQLQVPKVLLHTYPQDKLGMLVRQGVELGNGGSLVVDLLPEELLPGGARSQAGPQDPEAA